MAARPRDRQPPLLQLRLDDLPPSHPHLLVDRRHAPPVHLDVRQLEEPAAAAAGGLNLLEDLAGLLGLGEDGEEVLGGAEGVYKLDVGGNACALGGAYKAVWAMERKEGESFDDLIGKRWREDGAIQKVDRGYRDGVFQKYGNVLGAFEEMEQKILQG